MEKGTNTWVFEYQNVLPLWLIKLNCSQHNDTLTIYEFGYHKTVNRRSKLTTQWRGHYVWYIKYFHNITKN